MQARQTWHRRFGAGSAGRGRNRRRPPRRLEVSSEGQARGAWRRTKGMPSGRGPAHRCRRSARARKGWGTAGRSRRQARLAETRGRRCAGRACNGLRRALALCRLLPRLGWGSLCVAFGPPGVFPGLQGSARRRLGCRRLAPGRKAGSRPSLQMGVGGKRGKFFSHRRAGCRRVEVEVSQRAWLGTVKGKRRRAGKQVVEG